MVIMTPEYVITIDLNDLVSQSEPAIGCSQAVGVNVVDEDVGESVLGVSIVI